MEWLLEKILKRISLKKLAQSAYKVVYKKLQAHVESTANDFDDEALAVLDAIIVALIGEIKEA
jgi:phage major head subunit gpT-like protein